MHTPVSLHVPHDVACSVQVHAVCARSTDAAQLLPVMLCAFWCSVGLAARGLGGVPVQRFRPARRVVEGLVLSAADRCLHVHTARHVQRLRCHQCTYRVGAAAVQAC